MSCGSYGANLVTNGDFSTAVDKAAAKVVGSITKANPGVVTFAAAHGYVDGDVIYFASLDGMTELNGEYWKLRSNAGDTFELTTVWDTTSLDTSGYGAAEVSGNGTGQKCTASGWAPSAAGAWHPECDGAGALTNKEHCDGEQAGTAVLYHTDFVTIGKTYRIGITVSNYVQGAVDVRFATGTPGTLRIANGTYYEAVVAGDSDLRIYATNVGGVFIGTVDDIEVNECFGGGLGRFGGALTFT